MVKKAAPDIADLIKAPVAAMSDADAIACVAELIDLSGDARSERGIRRALGMLKEIERRNLTPAQQATLHYFRANAWDRKRPMAMPSPGQWEQPERQEQILALFMARNHEGFASLHKVRRCQILTNLGNQFNHVGRFIEAIELWDEALDILPNFAMARGNRGTGLKYYGLVSEDDYDRKVLLLAAHKAFVSATAKGALWDSFYPPAIKDQFKAEASQIAKQLDLEAIEKDLDLNSPALGRSKEERAYRHWCLQHRLFLNPLNDLGPHPIAASDLLMLPSLSVPFDEEAMPATIGLYNQMKQEYVFARLLLFEGDQSDSLHFADRRVRLHNTLDYPSFSMAIEKQRTAFRLAYSILDKVGYFINSYWQLGTEPHRVGFRSVWYDQAGETPRVQPRFASSENWPLRGLFWLSKDLFDDSFQRVTNPDARELFIIRNHLEHKYLQVHDSYVPHNPITGALGRSISSNDFASKALRLLKIARAAMIYLPLAVHMEERKRRHDSKAEFTIQMPLTSYDDRWRR